MNWLSALLLPVMIGSGVCRILLPSRHAFIIGPSVGFGITSCTYFLLLSKDIHLLIYVELLLLFVSWTCVYFFKGKTKAIESTEKPMTTIRITFWLVLIAQVVNFVLMMIPNPHGQWDSWTIWNSHARFLYRAGSDWQEAFSRLQPWSHPGYPLLISAATACGWQYLQHESVFIPIVIAGAYSFGIVGLLYSSVQQLRSRNQAMIAVLLLLATPIFLQVGASQLADVPVGFFILASFCLVLVAAGNLRMLFLAGICAGFTLWTKNEGVIFVIFFLFSYLIFILKTRSNRKQFLAVILGIFPVLLVVLYFKSHIAGTSVLQNSREILAHLLDVERYLLVFQAFGKQFIFPGGSKIPVVLVIIVYWLFRGSDVPGKEKKQIIFIGSTLCLLTLGYFITCVIGPSGVIVDLGWQLRNSVDRLFVQIWPSALLAAALVIRDHI